MLAVVAEQNATNVDEWLLWRLRRDLREMRPSESVPTTLADPYTAHFLGDSFVEYLASRCTSPVRKELSAYIREPHILAAEIERRILRVQLLIAYHADDRSMTEIAEKHGLSRTTVSDTIRRGERDLVARRKQKLGPQTMPQWLHPFKPEEVDESR